MDFQNPKDLKPKAARQLALDLQVRMLDIENCLDDLMRAVEIAQYSKQYNVTEVYVQQATELLQNRLVVPEIDQGPFKATIVESSEEGLEKALDIYNEDPTIDKRKHENIIGAVDQDGTSHVDIKNSKKRGNIHDAKA